MQISYLSGVSKMSNAARSIFIFGVYIIVSGTFALLAPNMVVTLFGLPPSSEVLILIRFVGLVFAILGGYYVQSARHNLVPFFGMTVVGRLVLVAGMAGFVLLGLTKPNLLLLAIGDFLGAIWTGLSLRKPR
jgi:hypothetical protein